MTRQFEARQYDPNNGTPNHPLVGQDDAWDHVCADLAEGLANLDRFAEHGPLPWPAVSLRKRIPVRPVAAPDDTAGPIPYTRPRPVWERYRSAA